MMRSLALGAVACLAIVGAAVAQTAPAPDFQWLEDITGAKAVVWVQGQNAAADHPRPEIWMLVEW